MATFRPGDVFPNPIRRRNNAPIPHVRLLGACLTNNSLIQRRNHVPLSQTCTVGEFSPTLASRGASQPRTQRALIRSGAATGGDRVSAEPKVQRIVTRSVNRVAPKVSPEMVGSLSRGNVRNPHRKHFRWGKLGGNPKEGGKQHLNVRRDVLCFEWGRSPEWGSPQNACILWGPRGGGGLYSQ